MDSRDAVLELILELLAEDEFRGGPSAGLVLQGYLRDSPGTLDTILAWLGGVDRAQPLTIRLVKGAYWDHELVQAAQHGWTAPVFERKADTDANFEVLTRRLLDARAGGDPGRDRLPQPALDRARDRLQPAHRRRRRGPRAAGPARARRPAAGRDRRPGPARAHVLPGRRSRGRYGLPRAATAGEHVERVVPVRAGARRAARRVAGGACVVTSPGGQRPNERGGGARRRSADDGGRNPSPTNRFSSCGGRRCARSCRARSRRSTPSR